MENIRRQENWIARLLLACAASWGVAAAAAPEPAAALQARYAALGEQFKQQPLTLVSAESDSSIRGDIYALVEYPFAVVGEMLGGTADWCDVLILHINTKQCRASSARPGVTVRTGRKFDEALEDTYSIDFALRASAAWGWSTSRRRVLSDWTMRGPSFTCRVYGCWGNYHVQ